MLRPIDGDGTSSCSTGSPSREYAAAVGVSATTIASTGSSAPRSTAQTQPSHTFTIGKLAARRARSLHGTQHLISLLSKAVNPRQFGRDTDDVPSWTAKFAEAFRSIEHAASRTFRRKIKSTP